MKVVRLVLLFSESGTGFLDTFLQNVLPIVFKCGDLAEILRIKRKITNI